MSGYGRDASLNATERKAPGTVAAAQLPGSPSASKASIGAEGADPFDGKHGVTGSLVLGHRPSQSCTTSFVLPCLLEDQLLFAALCAGKGHISLAPTCIQVGCSTLTGRSCCADADTGTPYSRRSDRSSEPGDVELMERSGTEFISYGAAGES